MPHWADGQIDKALASSRKGSSGPRATAARLDRRSGHLMVTLSDDRGFFFDPRRGQGLENASAPQLAKVEISAGGRGLYWPALDVDLSIQGLLEGLFGSEEFMKRTAASRLGSLTSEAKAAAARINGAKGGRPKKLATA